MKQYNYKCLVCGKTETYTDKRLFDKQDGRKCPMCYSPLWIPYMTDKDKQGHA